jgi:iduronate 2-sulfatase
MTISQHFRANGYKAYAIGKIFHVGHGNQEDADSWDDVPFKPRGKQYAIPANEADPNAKPSAGRPDKDPRGTATESADVPDESYGDGLIAKEAIRRLKEAKGSDSSFFLAVGFLKPHLPFIAPKKYWDLHDPAKLPQPERLTPPDGAPEYAPQFGGELRNYSDIPNDEKPLNPQLTRRLIHGYYAATSYMDAQIGRVLDALDETGFAENTIVVLWGDHGWHLGDHGMWCKHTNYEQATRIPLLVAYPDSRAGASSALIETVDVYPTLCELAALTIPDGLDGRSFAAVVKDPAVSHRDHAIHVYPRGQRLGRAIRTDRYRMVEWKTFGEKKPDATELYDYVNDPNESKNLAGELPEVVAELQKRLATHPEAKPPVKAAEGEGKKSKADGQKKKNKTAGAKN